MIVWANRVLNFKTGEWELLDKGSWPTIPKHLHFRQILVSVTMNVNAWMSRLHLVKCTFMCIMPEEARSVGIRSPGNGNTEVVNHHGGAGNRTPAPERASSSLNHWSITSCADQWLSEAGVLFCLSTVWQLILSDVSVSVVCFLFLFLN